VSGHLYQLRSYFKCFPGQYFEVNGPYDLHGVVIKSEHKPHKTDNREWLNLVRGTGKNEHIS